MSKWPLGSRINCFAGKVAYRIASDGNILPCNRTMDKSLKYNCLKDNFRDVLSRKLDAVCNGCWCITALELNYAFSLKLEPIFNIIRLDYLK
jgi:MoaA/NifB/PqqE/SkfB family radical SAM enzyme